MTRAFSLRVHSKAKLSVQNFDDRLELELINTLTDEVSKKNYWKLDSGIDMNEAMKIDMIIYYMHRDIGLNVWGDDKNKINEEEIG